MESVLLIYPPPHLSCQVLSQKTTGDISSFRKYDRAWAPIVVGKTNQRHLVCSGHMGRRITPRSPCRTSPDVLRAEWSMPPARHGRLPA